MTRAKFTYFRKNIFPYMFVCVLFWACSTNPEGRRRTILISDAEAIRISEQYFAEAKRKLPESVNEKSIAQIQKISHQIISKATQLYPEYVMRFNWEIHVVDNDASANAFVLPGGKIVIYSGLMPVVETEAGLGFVIAHEVAHAILRHGQEAMTKQLAPALLGNAIGYAVKAPKIVKVAARDMTAFGTGVFFNLPYSRVHEKEADAMGLKLMAHTGYDPKVAYGVFKRLHQFDDKKKTSFFSTHPTGPEREKNLDKFIQEATAIYDKQEKKYGSGSPVY